MEKRDPWTKWLGVYLTITLVMVLTMPGYATSASKQPIKFGYVGPMSGFYAHGGTHATQGMKLAFDEVNWTVAGRKIELVIEDDGWDVGAGITKAKKLVLSDKVDIMLGPHNGQVVIALKDFYKEHKMIHISPIADDSRLTRDKYSKYFFRANHDAIEDRYRVAGYFAYKKGYRKVLYMGPDFIPSRECIEGFKQVFEALGGKVTKEQFLPFGTTDFAPYFTKIDVKNTDAVYAFFFGGDAISFIKQYTEYGLKGRMPFLGIAVTDGALIKAEGEAALGIETVANYCPTFDTPVNKKFVAAYEKKFKMDVDFHADLGYVAAKVVLLGLEKVNGNTENVDNLIKAMEEVQFDAPRGPFRYGPNHAPIQNTYLRVVKKVNGQYQNFIVETVTNVGQGWMPEKLR